MHKKISNSLLIAVLMLVLLALTACGGDSSQTSQINGATSKTETDQKEEVVNSEAAEEELVSSENIEEQEDFVFEGTDVFEGNHFDGMLWGYYEEEGYEYSGSFDDSALFRQDMEYSTLSTEYGDIEVSVLPLTLQMGQYTHFMDSMFYEDEVYYPYTEEGKAAFRKLYMEEFGDLTEGDFQKIEKILRLNVAEMTFVEPDGNTRMGMFTYEINENKVAFYSLSIDEQYNILVGEEPFVQCDFMHDGGKLMLACQGIQRNYLTNGYHVEDPSLTFAGYALNEKNQYMDLEGFAFFQYGIDQDISVYVELANDESPVDPAIELDTETGSFTLSWTQRWVLTESGWDTVDDPQQISGTIIPVTNYGFTNYTGFIMKIDGIFYHYLMSMEEYDERRYSSVEEAENLTDFQLETLTIAKRNILKELEEACQKEGLAVSIDYETGKVNMEANFLFETDSYELSEEGKKYVDTFVDIYTAVILKDDYVPYLSEIIVEGHTDTAGSYSYNQTLSQNRADSIKSQAINRNSAIESIIHSEGCSYDYPIYNEDGSVNMDASRRVTFRFVLVDRS